LFRRITEQYFTNSLTIEEMREIAPSEGTDRLLTPFGEACCAEFASISATAWVAFPQGFTPRAGCEEASPPTKSAVAPPLLFYNAHTQRALTLLLARLAARVPC
jgi:hypothetical protein